MESRLRDQAALAKLGEMAAVVAHEVKNPLAGIRGAMQVFGSRMSPDDASAQVLKDIVARIDSLDQMMKDMLLFARPPKLKRTPTHPRRRRHRRYVLLDQVHRSWAGDTAGNT
jgi:signal transduction histidine kinase